MSVPTPIRVAAAAGALVLTAAACSSDSTAEPTTTTTVVSQDAGTQATRDTTTAEPTIVDVAASQPGFSTLVSAVKAADLVGTLSGPGPFTVFAPTNEAFAAIPADQLEALLADKALLTSILTYHVVPGAVMAADLQPTQQVTTAQGDSVDIEVTQDGATINGCNIVATDVEASNGVIHVIDCVLTP